ncbi:MAG TPA: signal peptide peptidase SppA [Pyrinomonadaceae bacterium]|nr:signal peptide peptidase SppA [Pyrinomonadaceae bacterium]
MSKTGKVLLIIGGVIFAFILVAIIGLAIAFESMGKPDVPDNSVLVLRVSGGLPDYAPEDPTARLFGVSQPQSFTSLLTQLRKAKVDARVGGVLLDIDFPQIGWGKAEELREAIKDFRASGKPIYSFMEIGMNKEYYIATATEKVFLPPAGDLYVNGFAAEAMFYKGSLDKLGIEAEVIQIGPKYKNAPDQYTKTKMGDGQKEVLDALLDEYYGRLKNGIAEARNKTPEDVEALINNAPYHADDAKKLGLIDDAFYRDQVYDQLKTRLGYKAEDKLRTIGGSEYREIPSDTLGLNKGEKIAVIYASGAINMGSSSKSPFGGEMVGADTIVKAVNDAAEDNSIKAIVLRVDSPGGSALASDLMWHALENAKAKKPVVVSMADVAASGGYYIACNANKIVAEPTTVTGSIGMFLGKPVLKGFYDWLGVSNEYVMRGKNAGIFRETEKWTDAEKAKMTELANKVYYGDFVPKVAKGRNKSDEEVNTLGQGRVWTGAQAKQNGLIDEFGGLEKAIEIAKGLANLPADKDVRRVAYPEPRSFFDTYFGSDDSTFTETEEFKAKKALIQTLPEDVRRSLRYAEVLDRMKKGEAMTMMPFELEIK